MKRVHNDTYRGWPVAPRKQQHPVRGSYLDPRLGRKYHHGIDISVRDDQPAPGAPPGRAHKVFAVEGGTVWKTIGPSAQRPDGLVRIAHFGYGHVDPIVREGETVAPGQLIGWTVKGHWHVHLSEWIFPGGNREKRIPVNPLDRDGKIAPFRDLAAPVILEVRFSTPATPPWGSVEGRAVFPVAGATIAQTALKGLVDVRARIEDHQSFQGWFVSLPVLEAPHHPARVHITVVRLADGKVVIDRDAFSCAGRLSPRGVPISSHYAPGTRQNLKAARAVDLDRPGRGELWFRLFAKRNGPPYWDTTRFANGPYALTIDAWDLVGNHSAHTVDVAIAN
jgi:hypothetical protein